MEVVDVDGDGNVAPEEFAETMFTILEAEIAQSKAPKRKKSKSKKKKKKAGVNVNDLPALSLEQKKPKVNVGNLLAI